MYPASTTLNMFAIGYAKNYAIVYTKPTVQEL